MAIDSDLALWHETATEYLNAKEYRRLLESLTQGLAFVGSPDELEVTEASPVALKVVVAPGAVVIPATTGLRMGSYFLYNDADVELDLDAADPSDDRIDLVVARIRDDEHDGGVTQEATIEVVAGVADPSPSVPATPDNSVALATVAVAALAASVSNADITDLRPQRPYTATRVTQVSAVNVSDGPTVGTTELTICSVTLPAELRPYDLVGMVNSTWTFDTAADAFSMRIKVDGVEKSEAWERTNSTNLRRTFTSVSALTRIAAGATCTVTVTLQRRLGTGVLDAESDASHLLTLNQYFQ